jgi:hypothetical protein
VSTPKHKLYHYTYIILVSDSYTIVLKRPHWWPIAGKYFIPTYTERVCIGSMDIVEEVR